jgi:nitroreductase
VHLSSASIAQRLSIRSYSGRGLDAAQTAAIQEAIESCGPPPLGPHPRFRLVAASEAGLAAAGAEGGAAKIGTYGMIKGAPAFILGAVEMQPFANEAFGYCLEGIILRAAELGLGTCWLGGGLRRGQVGEVLGLKQGEMVPCISPIGEAAEKRSIMDRIVRSSAKGDSRKPGRELFFEGEPGHPLILDEASPWAPVLEAVRRAPSASNKQPWRIVKSGSSARPVFHLLLDEDKAYNSVMGAVKIQNVDMGIAMRHFEVEARNQGLAGSWQRLSSPPVAESAPISYIATWAP